MRKVTFSVIYILKTIEVLGIKKPLKLSFEGLTSFFVTVEGFLPRSFKLRIPNEKSPHVPVARGFFFYGLPFASKLADQPIEKAPQTFI